MENKELTFNDLPQVVAQLRDEVMGMRTLLIKQQEENRKQRNLELPSSVIMVASYCLAGCFSLESIHVKWTNLNNVYWEDNCADDRLTPGIELYVPTGFANLYRGEPWDFFTIIEEGEVPPMEESYLYILGCDGNWDPANAPVPLRSEATDAMEAT